jgi:hypothetical protein
MNYQQEIPNSQGILNKNNVGVTTQIFNLTGNRKRIFLPIPLNMIIGFKVKSICWDVAPASFAFSTMFMISSDDLIEDSINQSQLILPNPIDPNKFECYQLPIIATWVLDKLPAVISPNSQVPNFEQPTIWLKRPLSLQSVLFNITTSIDPDVVYDSTNKVFLTLEFYYFMKTTNELLKIK